MPFKAAENPKCPKCGKSVYAAEERVAGGHKFHKGCFKCGMCQKFLDSTNCAEHEAELYCKNCHGRKYGPKGYGFGGGAGCLSMDSGDQFKNQEAEDAAKRPPRPMTKAPEGEGCPRCGAFVYAAEQMLARGRPWHKGCFSCNACQRGLDSKNMTEAPDKEIYCKTCYGKRFGPKGYGFGGGAGALQCEEYASGETHAPKTTVADTASIKAKEGEGCPRCGGAVFAAEMMLSKGQEWHKKCYSCHDCKRPLDSMVACDGPDKDVYCKTCYGKKWGPHGYGFACGGGFLQTDGQSEDDVTQNRPFIVSSTTTIKPTDGSGCPRCGGAVFAAEQQLAKGSMWHKKCFSCNECKRPLDSMLACDGPDKEIHCRSCYGRLYGPKGFGYGHTPTLSTNGESTLNSVSNIGGARPTDGTGCPRCGFVVYAAEQMISKSNSWHKRCFNCSDCHRSLDSTNLCDAPNGEIYCRGCYGRLFGPRGVGFGMGAGVLSMV